jgi:hypothetical protein
MKTTALVLTAALFALVLPLAMSAQDKAGAPETSITGCFKWIGILNALSLGGDWGLLGGRGWGCRGDWTDSNAMSAGALGSPRHGDHSPPLQRGCSGRLLQTR